MKGPFRSVALIALGSALACAGGPQPAMPADPKTWLIVTGRVRLDGAVSGERGEIVSAATVRATASASRDCDGHAHLGGGQPAVVRTDATGMYRHTVIASGYPDCVQVDVEVRP